MMKKILYIMVILAAVSAFFFKDVVKTDSSIHDIVKVKRLDEFYLRYSIGDIKLFLQTTFDKKCITEEVGEEINNVLKTHLDFDKILKPLIIKSYEDEYNSEELQQLLAFYNSNAGKEYTSRLLGESIKVSENSIKEAIKFASTPAGEDIRELNVNDKIFDFLRTQNEAIKKEIWLVIENRTEC